MNIEIIHTIGDEHLVALIDDADQVVGIIQPDGTLETAYAQEYQYSERVATVDSIPAPGGITPDRAKRWHEEIEIV